ncbi:hypothetical protein B0H17DRAFT_1302344 [Mycena rosella]|uniref:Uncharacterized protein n=1 Tax=Mycena rosella TaxID=1033263 RepID=A0AAD7GGH9_MYCRO|nr:hypothetical protein B0H17DRAFT_1302344 [Mycena rosella]
MMRVDSRGEKEEERRLRNRQTVVWVRLPEPKLYIPSSLAQYVVDILDAEGIAKVIVIGTDWCVPRLAPSLGHYAHIGCAGGHGGALACAFLGVGYGPPGSAHKNAIMHPELMTQLTGYDNFAYIRFFFEPDAAVIIEKNIDSFINIIYPEVTVSGPTEFFFWRFPKMAKTGQWATTLNRSFEFVLATPMYPKSTKGYGNAIIYTQKMNPRYMNTMSDSLQAKDDG